MRKNWLLLAVGLLAAILALGAIACGDDDDDDGNGGDQPTATAEAPEDPEPTEPAEDEPTEEPANGGEGATITATGGILTDAAGNTLYIFDNDEAGVSNCGDGCVGVWPPLTVDGEATAGEGLTGTVGTITRDDGSTQVTYDDQPLYYYSGDEAPGDTNGDGIGGIWHIISVG